MKRIRLAAALVVLTAAFSQKAVVAQGGAAKPAPPTPPLPNISSCQVPLDTETNMPPDAHPYEQLPYLDDYSWRAFAALICAAKNGQRGKANPALGRDGKEARVFETFKSAWEVFHPNPGSVSGDFGKYEDNKYNPCRADAAPGDLVLASVSKFFDTNQAGVGRDDYIGPLPAQNRTYVHYLTQYNLESFQRLLQGLRGDTTGPFPDGSVNVKSAWVEMKGLNNPDHFYVRKAWIPKSGGHCEKVEVGLVGLHIVQKTPTRPRWIWSTFEQVDNAPDADGKCPPSGGPYTFNNGDCTDMPKRPPPADANRPGFPPKYIFNVQRTNHGIFNGTGSTNEKYQAKFARDSKWRYYELVMTQWPIGDPKPSQGGALHFTFPGSGSISAYANTAMETFFQGGAGPTKLTCMACHAKAATDFVWSLGIEPPGSRVAALKLVQQTIENAGIHAQ
jgi:hypothetical protein